VESEERRAEFLKVAGNALDHLFALVNIEADTDEWRGIVFVRTGGEWQTFYSDEEFACTDIAVFPDGTIYIARDDGSLLEGSQSGLRLIETPNKRGCSLTVISNENLLVMGNYLFLYDKSTAQLERLSERKLDWGPAKVYGDTIYVVEMRMRVVRIRNKQLEFLPYDRTNRLADVCISASGLLYAGGWKEGLRGLLQCYESEKWKELALPTRLSVDGIVNRGKQLVVSIGGGTFVFDELNQSWQCEIDLAEGVHALTWIGDQLLACHCYSGAISVWQSQGWQKTIMPVPLEKPA
jgi:hypothetical protein